jgi:hypothetical protein
MCPVDEIDTPKCDICGKPWPPSGVVTIFEDDQEGIDFGGDTDIYAVCCSDECAKQARLERDKGVHQ